LTKSGFVIASELQHIIDRLAADLGAATVLEDARQRMIVYSSQYGEVDQVRRDSILLRETAPEVVGWFRRFGISDVRETIWIAGSPQLAILGRVCCPIRYGDQLLGFLWLLDDRREIFDTRRERIETDHAHIALLLYEQQLAQRLRGEVVSHLLSPVPDLQAAAAASIVDRGQWQRGARACAVVVSVAAGQATARSEHSHALVHRVLVESLEDVARNTVGSDALRAAFADHAVLLVPCWTAADERPDEIGERAITAVERHIADGFLVAAGIGDPQESVRDAHVSYRQARLAAKIAGVISSGRACARWRDLGVFRTLAQLPSWGAGDLDLDPRVTVLLNHADPDVVRSVETYLDLGCDVQKTAAALHLHRGTLYYRLEKVEKLTGLDLRDGNDRLAVHLGFKIARLTGAYPR
jgi:sugar diacid utilization regulator